MLKTNIAQTLTYPAYLDAVSNKAASSTGIKQNSVTINDGNLDNALIAKEYAGFASTMSAIVKIPEGYKNLSFYNAAGELRGNSRIQNVEGVDLAFITIYGNAPEMLTAYIGTENSVQATSKSISFSADAILGNIHNPIIIDLLEVPIRVSPNPFKTILEIAFPSKEVGDAKIVVYNMISQKVFESNFKINVGANVFKIQPSIPTGAYIVEVHVGDKVVFKKVIKD